MKSFLKMVSMLAAFGLVLAFVTACDNPSGPSDPTTATVTFNANGGTGTVPSPQSVNRGSSITLPNPAWLSRSGHSFGGWNTNANGTGTHYDIGDSITLNGNITLFARWIPLVFDENALLVPGNDLSEQLAWLRDNAQSGGQYLVEISRTETISPVSLFPSWYNLTNIAIILRGSGTMRTVNLSGSGSLFGISSGVTLILGGNITLLGGSGNTAPLVAVGSGGSLIMNAGSRIAGNSNTAGSGGGVRVEGNGTFTMHGGEILDNTAAESGGGVYVVSASTEWWGSQPAGTFNMRGGTISGNSAVYGGGVRAEIFRMSDGTVYGNETAVAIGLRNTASSEWAVGAALSAGAYAQHGVFNAAGVFLSVGVLPSADFTLYVRNGVVQRVDGNFAEQIAWLQAFAQSGNRYTVEIRANETIDPWQARLPGSESQDNRSDIAITLRGSGAMRTITFASPFFGSSGFSVPSGVTLILDNNITLQCGTTGQRREPLISVGGTLIMNTGSRITADRDTFLSPASVFVLGTVIMNDGEISGLFTSIAANGIFTMHRGAIENGFGVGNSGSFNMRGGEISNNDGGGLFNSGTFNMYGGEISANICYGGGSGVNNSGTFNMHNGRISHNRNIIGNGGGVNNDGTFHMHGGEILANTAGYGGGGIGGGGGVFNVGIFTMHRGEISGNTAILSYGRGGSAGGVLNVDSGIFNMYGGNIRRNTAVGAGGAVRNGGTFNLHAGEISGNAAHSGGGVYNRWGTFNMRGGEISANTAYYGGGVHNCCCSQGTFNISNGTIHGTNAAVGLRNNAAYSGAALHGRANRGTFNAAGHFTGLGEFDTRETTIRVTNGILQP